MRRDKSWHHLVSMHRPVWQETSSLSGYVRGSDNSWELGQHIPPALSQLSSTWGTCCDGYTTWETQLDELGRHERRVV